MIIPNISPGKNNPIILPRNSSSRGKIIAINRRWFGVSALNRAGVGKSRVAAGISRTNLIRMKATIAVNLVRIGSGVGGNGVKKSVVVINLKAGFVSAVICPPKGNIRLISRRGARGKINRTSQAGRSGGGSFRPRATSSTTIGAGLANTGVGGTATIRSAWGRRRRSTKATTPTLISTIMAKPRGIFPATITVSAIAPIPFTIRAPTARTPIVIISPSFTRTRTTRHSTTTCLISISWRKKEGF